MARRKTHDEYVLEVANINPNIEVVGTYVNSYTPILHRCKIDGCEWSPRPNSIIQGCGCPECGRLNASTKRTKTHEQYIAEVLKINPNIEVVGEYSGDGTPILHRCKIDAYEWMATSNNILRGTGCPKCNISKGEMAISKFLDDINVRYEQQKRFNDCRDKYTLPFDFYLPDYNVCIEYNGIQHYEPVEVFGGEEALQGTIKRDKIKEAYCNRNGIRLLQIPYYNDMHDELERLNALLMCG